MNDAMKFKLAPALTAPRAADQRQEPKLFTSARARAGSALTFRSCKFGLNESNITRKDRNDFFFEI